jgi:dCTP deaminase
MSKPWDDWIPGVLNKRQMLQLSTEGLLTGIDGVVGQASLDLSISGEVYKMREGSVKPAWGDQYSVFLRNPKLAERINFDNDRRLTLETKETYVFKLEQRLHPQFEAVGIFGEATAKSSTGRMDVLARLIVDGVGQYERFDADSLRGQSGDMYLEVTPITFRVRVEEQQCLSQLRLFYGSRSDAEISGKQIFRTVFKESDSDDGTLSVDLTNTKEGGLSVAAFCAEPIQNAEPICLWTAQNRPEPWKSWKFKKSGRDKRLTIENDKFYILRSKEKIRVPAGIAIYCRASDETIGEMRIHYAGFVHPHFGATRKDEEPGTPLIFEVRGHQVDVNLRHGERLAHLVLYRMSEDAQPDDEGTYDQQELKLSKFFNNWPQKLRLLDEDGTVEPMKEGDENGKDEAT